MCEAPTESISRFVYFNVDVKFWAKQPPDVATARPARCPVCEAPGVEDGRVLLHGHGRRERRVGVPSDTKGNTEELELLLRRYACQRCKAVIVVGPRGLLRGRHYSAMAIALALWLWAVCHHSDAAVRTTSCAVEYRGLSRPERWTTLRRWARAGRDGELWSSPPVDPSWTLRQCAERVARWLRSLGDPAAVSDEHGVISGAAHAR
jgi:hypothetical protein